MPRKKTFQAFKEAGLAGPYDERPMLPDDVHVQMCLSRNDRPQPFHLICEKDTLLALLRGEGQVEFKSTSVSSFALEFGDHVYVPAGVPHRIVPSGECVVLRYTAQQPGLEGAAWYCEHCGAELWRSVWDTAVTLSQEGYTAACEQFNRSNDLRHCASCSSDRTAIDLTPYRWREIAAEIRSERNAPG